jgi:hypothetical protein
VCASTHLYNHSSTTSFGDLQCRCIYLQHHVYAVLTSTSHAYHIHILFLFHMQVAKRVKRMNSVIRALTRNHRPRRGSDSSSSRSSSPAPGHLVHENSGYSRHDSNRGAPNKCEAYGCNKVLGRWSGKHVCGKCNRTMCQAHTAVHPHSSLSRCAIQSQCRCRSCHDVVASL